MKNSFIAILILAGSIANAQYVSETMPPPPPALDLSKPKDNVILHGDVKEFPREILKWDIKTLSISADKGFTKIPEEIKNYKNLTHFSMSGGTEVSVFPNGFSKLENLRNISIYSNYIKVFPQQFLKLNLEELYLFCPYLEKLPDNLGDLENVKKLSIIGREYKSVFINDKEVFLQPLSLPKSIKKLKKVESFMLSKNMLKSIPEEIGEMDNLVRLYLADNDLETLPGSIARLKKLKSIDLSKNKFKVFPAALYDTENVEAIYYSENSIESFPVGIDKMKNLRHLFADKCKMSSLALAELWNASSLETLDLSNCQIQNLPPGVEKLTQLKSLSFWGNKLSPADLEKLKRNLPNTKVTLINPYKPF